VRLGSDVPTISALKNPAATPYVQDTVIQDSFGEWISGKGFSKKKNTSLLQAVMPAAAISGGWTAMFPHSSMPSI
jgi:hypothetical protein